MKYWVNPIVYIYMLAFCCHIHIDKKSTFNLDIPDYLQDYEITHPHYENINYCYYYTLCKADS